MVDPEVQKAFSKVKEDMALLKEGLEKAKKEILEKNRLIKELDSKLEDVLCKNMDLREDLNLLESSIGNKGVINDHQRSASISINDQQSKSTPNNSKKGDINLDETLTFRFKQLSDREFSLFLAIYELEQELGEVTFTDLADKLELSEPAIRNVVNRLLTKQIPVTKERFFNGKARLSIQNGFKYPKLIAALIALRQGNAFQTRLSDI